jgi:peptidoglycan/xylan/chitin deacetylase (PgdA/CDA1 family)
VKTLATVMYHYVRPIGRSRWPRIRGLEIDDFRAQLAYLKRTYTIVSLPEVIDALDGGDLPDNACLLTFDDGYADHYQHVFPLLVDAKVSGAFFPIGRSVAERVVADVNKIHFILHEGNLKWLVGRCRYLAVENPSDAGRFDDAETAFVKRILQQAASVDEVDGLFKSIVTDDYQGDLANELYMTSDQIRCMAANGMHFGVHGWNHVRFSRMTEAEQAADLDASIAFLRGLGVLPERWAMAYPYGAREDFDGITVDLLKARDCAAAFTTRSAAEPLVSESRYCLPRLDTNDVPRA